MENPENTSTVNGTTNIAVGTPLAAAGWVSADRLALAIMGNDSVADIRNVLAGFAPGTGFAVGSESKLPPALVCACQDHNERNTFIVSALLEHGADVNESYRGDGFTPLIQCAKTGNLEMIELLLEAGADVERVSKDGRSALSVAIGNGRTDMARRLLPPRGRADALRVDCGRTALMEAARRGQYDVATALVEHGADVDLVDDCQKTALMLSLEEGVSNKKLLKLLMSERSVNLADEMGATLSRSRYPRKSRPLRSFSSTRSVILAGTDARSRERTRRESASRSFMPSSTTPGRSLCARCWSGVRRPSAQWMERRR